MRKLKEALDLRTEARQPLEWPDGTAPPLSRVALTALILQACDEHDLATLGWDVPLLRPERMEEDIDYAFGDAIGAVVERVWCGYLGAVGAWQPEASYTLGNLIVELEGAFLELWHPLAAVGDPEVEALAAIAVAAGRSLSPATRLWEAIPPEKISTFWAQLDSPWFELMPALPSVRRYWLSPARLCWPKELVTVGDLAALLAENYRAQRERLAQIR